MPRKQTKAKPIKPKTTQPKSIKSKGLLPSTHDKNGKKLNDYQKFMATALRKHSRNENISQKEKMKSSVSTWNEYKVGFILPSQHLPSHLNETLPK